MNLSNRLLVIAGILGCLQFSCSGGSSGKPSNAEAGASESQARVPAKASVSGRMAEKLDRSTALALVKERFPVPPLNGSSMRVDPIVQWKVKGDALNEGFGNMTTEEWLAMEKRLGNARLDSHRKLVAEGFLREVQCAQTYDYLERHCFGAAQHPDVGGVNQLGIAITLSRPRWGDVTGIVQEGLRARADVLAALMPTDAWKRLAPIIEKAGVRDLSNNLVTPPGFGLEGGPMNRHEEYLRLISVREINLMQNYRFIRYDDGWRVE